MNQEEQLSHNYAMALALEDSILQALDSCDPMRRLIRLANIVREAREDRAAQECEEMLR